MKECSSIYGKAIFVFLCSFPHRIYCFLHFMCSWPTHIRALSTYRKAKKNITVRRLSDSPTPSLVAFDLARELLPEENHSSTPAHTLYELFCSLRDEEMTPSWKIPTISELHLVMKELRADIEGSPLARLPLRTLSFWVLDEDRHAFVGYYPFLPTDSEDRIHEDGNHFAYAIWVTVSP